MITDILKYDDEQITKLSSKKLHLEMSTYPVTEQCNQHFFLIILLDETRNFTTLFFSQIRLSDILIITPIAAHKNNQLRRSCKLEKTTMK